MLILDNCSYLQIQAVPIIEAMFNCDKPKEYSRNSPSTCLKIAALLHRGYFTAAPANLLILFSSGKNNIL